MSVEKDIGELEALKVLTPYDLDISYLDHRARKTTRLVGNTSPENYVKGRHRNYDFEFKEPQFVNKIEFNTVDYVDGSKADFTCTHYYSGRSIKSEVVNVGNSWVVIINGFIQNFSIEPKKKYLGNQLLTAVRITGLLPEDFFEVAKQIGSIERLHKSALEKCKDRLSTVAEKEAEVDSLDQKISDLKESIDDIEINKSELEDEIELVQEKFDSMERSIGSKKQELSEYSARIESAESAIEQKAEERKQLSFEITKNKAELRELKENINLFPTEISGFVDQGSSNIKKYTLLSAIPIIIIGLVTVDLFSKASELSHLKNLPKGISIWEILLARLPYVLVCGALIASSYKLARVFIAEIIRINEQRLSLTKISIIAKDVSDASEDGLSLDDVARYEHRTHLKMDLLRAHLKGYLQDDYRYTRKKVSSSDRQSEEGIEDESDNDN